MHSDKPNERLSKLLRRYADKGLYSHAYASVARLTDAHSITKAMIGSEKTYFDLSSLTKALVTTPLIFKELEEHGLLLNATLLDWAKSFSSTDQYAFNHLLGIRFNDLLSHTSGLPAWRNFYVCKIEKNKEINTYLDQPSRHAHMSEVLSRVSIDSEKLGQDTYSDLGMILLGLLLEIKYQKNLDLIFDDFLNSVLRFSRNSIQYRSQLLSIHKDSFASTGYCHLRGRELQGEVHDENCAAIGGVSGHAGLFGTGEAVFKYLQHLFNSDLGKIIWRENASKIKPNNPSLLGFRQGNDDSANTFAHGLSMGHLGFTGTAFWICPKSERVAVLLTNRVKMQRLNPEIKHCRREVFALLDELSC